MKQIPNSGDSGLVSDSKVGTIPRSETIFEYQEKRGITLVLAKTTAEEVGLS